jgi:uncharacterized protein YdeI (YjbR/CyaY-like superfamily)
MKKMNPKVDFYFNKTGTWQDEIKKLRSIVLETGVTEELKWGVPCYTFEGRNVVLLHVFKEYCALLFFKGVLLKDPKGILVQQTQHVQAARQIRFTGVRDIIKMKGVIKAFIAEAIEVNQAGLKVPLKKTSEFPMPEEFKKELRENPDLKTAFAALTPGRQRAYILYFAAPKQSKTRDARIEKCKEKIMNGEGLNDP